MTRIFYETIAMALLIAIFGEAGIRWGTARVNAWLDAPPKKPCQSITEFDEMEEKQW